MRCVRVHVRVAQAIDPRDASALELDQRGIMAAFTTRSQTLTHRVRYDLVWREISKFADRVSCDGETVR